jgi:hypothetical protein
MSVLRRALNARTVRTAALAGIAAGAALSLTACNTDTGSAAAGSSSSSSQSSGSSGSSGSGSSGSSADTAASDVAAGGQCQTKDLNIFFGGRDNSGAGNVQTVALVNKGQGTCTLKGFPGVDLKDATHTWSLERSSTDAAKVTLAPSDEALFTINLVPAEGSGPAFTPTTAVITPPNETHSVSLKWEAGSIVQQDGATHPGTFVNPVVPNFSS